MQIKIFKHCLHRDVKAESRRTVERRRDAMRAWQALKEASGSDELQAMLSWLKSASTQTTFKEPGNAFLVARLSETRNSLVLAQRQARRFQAELLLAIGSEGESV